MIYDVAIIGGGPGGRPAWGVPSVGPAAGGLPHADLALTSASKWLVW